MFENSFFAVVIGLIVALGAGCGSVPKLSPDQDRASVSKFPTSGEISEAKNQAKAVLSVMKGIRESGEFLGILPAYTCGESQSLFSSQALTKLQSSFSCGTATLSSNPENHAIDVVFSERGCTFQSLAVTGRMRFTLSGGDRRFEIHADFRSLFINGVQLLATAGHGTCENKARAWFSIERPVDSSKNESIRIIGSLAMREGLPILGGTTLLIDGSGERSTSEGKDILTFKGLEYEVGKILPKNGELVLETHNGKRISIVFREKYFFLGEVEITIDKYRSVTVPLIL